MERLDVLFYPGEDAGDMYSLNKTISGNTPETAIDPWLLSNANAQGFEMPDGCNSLYVNCPDETEAGWLLIDGVFLDGDAFINWRDNLMEKGAPPRSSQELAEDKRIAEEDRLRTEAQAKQLEKENKIREAEAVRLANLRPEKKGEIALARIIDLDNYSVALMELDINNTTVKDLRRLISKVHGSAAGERPLASTNYYTAKGLSDLTKKNIGKISENITTRHLLASVVTDEGYGQPKMRVPSNTRSTLEDNVRLADMKGEVVVYFYNSMPRSPLKFEDVFVSELGIKLLAGVGRFL